MIPKIIHYCWFGKGQKPKLAEKCIKSWKKYCPDYKIVEWNEDNIDISSMPLYVQQAYQAKKWAFVTDYVRLQIIYKNGGIYFDTDVELKKNLDFLLQYNAFFGFEDGIHINTGLGFGAVMGASVLAEMMQDYQNIPFIKEDGSFDQMPCPQRNTRVLVERGLRQNDERQILDENILILPSIYFCPISTLTGKRKYSFKTIAIHWFAASWLTIAGMDRNELFITRVKKRHKEQRRDWLIHIPNRMLRRIMGETLYENFKSRLKRK